MSQPSSSQEIPSMNSNSDLLKLKTSETLQHDDLNINSINILQNNQHISDSVDNSVETRDIKSDDLLKKTNDNKNEGNNDNDDNVVIGVDEPMNNINIETHHYSDNENANTNTNSNADNDDNEEEEEEEEGEGDMTTESTVEPGTIASRSKRRSTRSINYKEKLETDIPANIIKVEKRAYKSRRGKSSSDSVSPAPSSSEQISSSLSSSHHHSVSSSSSSSSSNSKNSLYFDVEDVVPINYQPPIEPGTDFNESIDIRGAKMDSNEILLTLKNGTVIKKGDCIYMICEPSTEPFYIAQILGFTKKDKTSTNKKASNYMFSVCWFYRPRDLNRRLTDTRLVYASLHRDNCPLTSFRGFATVKHKSDIEDLEAYRQQPDCFFFDKLYDRYMIKMYDMIPTSQLVHLPPNYYKMLNKRFSYIFVEVGKADELLSSPKNCEKCLQWCSNSDSISCSGCQKSYHLLCLDPPILTKPKRGFAWYCAACNKCLEDKLAESRGKMLESSQPSMIMKKEERDLKEQKEITEISTSDSNLNQINESDDTQEADSSSLKYEQLAKKFLEDDKNISFKRRREIEEWPYRYLGVHAKFEDALDLQDRPYARAASRLGSKYQCTSLVDWYDHTVQYYDTIDSSSGSGKKMKKYYNRSKKSSTPILNEEDDDLENKQKFPIPDEYKDLKPKQFPGWLQPKPKGYIERGGDDTSKLLWEMPKNIGISEKEIDDMIEKYIKDCSPVAKKLKLATVTTPNFMDAILLILMRHDYKPEDCMSDVQQLTRDSLKEPTFTDEEVKRFEAAVRLYGSELYPVYKEVKTQTSAMVVRFYYLWKKTKSGHEIWDNFPGRAKNRLKSTKNIGVDLDNPDDDGTFASGKINRSQVKFKCTYCETNHSPEWFRAPGANADEENHIYEGLCYRCAKLWRKYAVKWENPVELIKNQEKKVSYTVKKRIESALIQEAELVVNARENYKIHPRKITDGLKKFKTIDTDLDYSFAIGPPTTQEKMKKKSGRKTSLKNVTQGLSSSPPSSSSSSVSKLSFESKIKVKKEKKETSKKSGKRSRELAVPADESLLTETTDETDVPKKRRPYKKRQKGENSLKFVYGKVISDASKGQLRFTTKKKDLVSGEDGIPRITKLKDQLEETKLQLEENAKSDFFNAFLDMKLREKIEAIEKEISLNSETTAEPPYDTMSSAQGSQSIEIISNPESTPSAGKSQASANGGETYVFQSGKKYIRRRLFLSKTSVPGSGVFETPPIQIPSDAISALSTTSVHQNNLRNKFVFKIQDQQNQPLDSEYNSQNSEIQFQSQPNLLPIVASDPISNKSSGITGSTMPSSLSQTSPQMFSDSQPGITAPQMFPQTNSQNLSVTDPTPSTNKILSSSSSSPSSSSPSTLSKKKKDPPSFLSSALKSKEFVSLSSSFKVKMLTPLIDFNDRITKKMISRYTTKFDIFNPLLSDDFYVSPIYQMRSSSRELHILWKQYQTSRKSKGKASRQFTPLYASDKRECCVCREFGDTKKMLICSNCGLNVHSSCYGVKINSKLMDKEAGQYNWHCDTCSNDLHPLISTQYVCLLCNSRESNMDNAIKGDPVSIPDALKRTVEGRWCHVTCALLCDDVKFGSDILQPIYGAPVTGIKNIFKSCNICLGNGGSVVKCEFCTAKSHVTCGLDFGWKCGFKLVDIYDSMDGDVIEICESGKIGKLKPIFHCDKHNDDSEIPFIYDLNTKANIYGEINEFTLIELFTRDERKRIKEPNSGILRRRAYDEMNYQFGELVLTNLNADTDWDMELESTDHSCNQCGRKSSLIWYSNGEHGSELCHICRRNDKIKELEDNDKIGEMAVEEISVDEIFEGVVKREGKEKIFNVPNLHNVNIESFDHSLYGC
ncbi:putative PHD type zinc finger protein with BAH domain-containing protein [Pichia californica]|uniref:PHD type zinc finger protein with BAH domain-containing protein n=1 Tax=Pichia californica TaxID=460514 RepID=A0A9P7BEU0_9ASCO|nr:putative PHD type zinc finger protein with BAH domain-containing protein [[Candida] californica]